MPRPKKRAFKRSEWIFDWKRSTSTPVSFWFAVVLVGGIFALAIISLRVKLVQPVALEAPQASVIHLRGEGWSRSLAMEARAKGPFPSRFEPTAWSGTETMQDVVQEASRPRLAAHQPRLLPFPDPAIEPPSMARRGEPVLPGRGFDFGPAETTGPLRLVPTLSPVDGISAAELPVQLPPWDQPVTEGLAARSWKFLIELEPNGRVRQCVSLAGGQELSPPELSAWLRSAVFAAREREQGRRWAAVAVEFENRMQEDGTESQ